MAEKKLHRSARATRELRQIIRSSSASIESLAREHNLNRKTVAKWRRRDSVEDAPMGPRKRFPSLYPWEVILILNFRTKTNLPLDDCFHYLSEMLPDLTRSALYRCLLKHGFNRLPDHAERMSGTELFDVVTRFQEWAGIASTVNQHILVRRSAGLPVSRGPGPLAEDVAKFFEHNLGVSFRTDAQGTW